MDSMAAPELQVARAPGEESALARARDWALVLFLLFAAVVNVRAFATYYFDDSFITYKYAANLAAGQGFVFNPGERVLGTSTPLYAMLLGLLGALGLDVAACGAWLYCLCLSLAGFLGFKMLKEHGAPNAGAVFAVAVAWGTGGVFVHFGMETALYIALIFGAFWIAPRGRPWTTGVLLGCIALTRYDGVIAVGMVLLYRWLRARQLPWREAVVAGAMLGSWLLFALVYFGSPLPNTLAAKAESSTFWEYWRQSLNHQFLLLVSPLQRYREMRGTGDGARIATGVLLLLPALIGARRLPLRLWFVAAFAFLLWLGYAVIGPPLNQRWYQTPALFGLLAFALAGWALVLPWGRLRALAPAGVLALVLYSAVALPARSRAEYDQMTHGPDYVNRVVAYGEIATWIRHHELEHTRLLTLEPGYLSYLTGQPVIDGAGLVTPGIHFHGPVEQRDTLLSIIEERQPDMVLVRSETTPLHPKIARDYVSVYQVRTMQLLLRRSLLDEHVDRLQRTWLEPDFYFPGDEPAVRHPIAIDFERANVPGWTTGVIGPNYVGFPRKHLKFEGVRIRDPYLHTCAGTRPRGALVWGAPFLIDFDELALRFGATDPDLTKLLLFVNGVQVLEVPGRGPRPLPVVREVELPVYSWKGNVGALLFLDRDASKNYLVADHITSGRYAGFTPFDDFESGAFGERWLEHFGDAPLASRDLARRFGPSLTLGRHVAASFGLGGPQRMVSRPFAIEHDFLSLVVCDFAGPGSRVELLVDGEPLQSFECTGSDSLASLKWDLSAARGREATLVAVDAEDAPERWIGIDSIALHDGVPPSAAAPAGSPEGGE